MTHGFQRITVEARDHIRVIGLNRPEKRNAADFTMLSELFSAFGDADRDPEVRVVLVHAIGDHFTAGLDLADVAPHVGPAGLELEVPGGRDPWQLVTEPMTKPVVVAVQGTCLTLGIELILASDVTVAASNVRFAQIEVSRGILPFGGATIRFAERCGWGDAMKHILSADAFDAAEALRIRLVQQVVEPALLFETAYGVAAQIAAQAPLAVQATLANAKLARKDPSAAVAALGPELARLSQTRDAQRGMTAFATRTIAQFDGT